MASIKQPLRPTYIRDSLWALRDIYGTEAEFIAFWELYSLRERYKLSSMRYHNIWIMNPVLHTSSTPDKCHRPDLTTVWWFKDTATNCWSAVLAGLGAQINADNVEAHRYLTVLSFEDRANLKAPTVRKCSLTLLTDTELMPRAQGPLGVLSIPRYALDEMAEVVATYINQQELEIRRNSFDRAPTVKP